MKCDICHKTLGKIYYEDDVFHIRHCPVCRRIIKKGKELIFKKEGDE